ncbi:MAG TPA: InlB B-repeat-containing protein [Candidatus Avimonas sp.]|nr:InlB B-repeat-containing protein [Candidatus Avimonas sp.]
MVVYQKITLRKMLAIIFSLVIAASILIAPVSVAALTDGSYISVDYSTQLTLDTPAISSISSEAETFDSEYGEFYLDKGYSINLTAGNSYLFIYSASLNVFAEKTLQPVLIILNGGEFAGNESDILEFEYNYDWDMATVNLFFTPTTSGNYRVLTGCYFDDEDTVVNTELLVIKTSPAKWDADLVGDDHEDEGYIDSMYTTSAPDGTIYTISNYTPYGEYWWLFYPGTYTLFAFSPDGEMLWSYDLGLPSYSQPLVGTDGTIYVATVNGINDENEFYSTSYGYGSSYIFALNPDGSEKWVKEFKAEYDEINDVVTLYHFYHQMALSKSGILVLYSENLYQDYKILVAVDVNNGGEILWEKSEDSELGFEHYDDWVSPVIYKDTIYIPVVKEGYCGIAAYRLADGEELWFLYVDDCCGASKCSISVDKDGIIYLVGDGEVEIDGEILECPVYAINPGGTIKWVKDIGMYNEGIFLTAVDDRYLYVGFPNDVYVLNKNTGELVTQFGDMNEFGVLYSLAVLGDGSVLAEYTGYYGDILIKRFTSDGIFTDAYYIDYYYDTYVLPMFTVTKDGYLAISYYGRLYCFDLGAPLAGGWTVNGANGAYTNSLFPNTVTFVLNGGTEVPPQTVFTGEMAVKPDDPTRASEAISDTVTRVYTFDKWYIDEECTVPYDFSTPVIDDITLYAGWLYEDKTETTEPTKPVPPPLLMRSRFPHRPARAKAMYSGYCFLPQLQEYSAGSVR